MMCPLMIIGDYLKKGGQYGEIGNCLKEECAWWDDGEPDCAMLTLAKELSALRQIVEVLHLRESQ